MKMKSKFLGFNASLALMLIAICGMFASCYEKEDLDVSKPGSTIAPVYTILGAVQDGTDGGPLAGVKVSIQGGAEATTGVNGAYSVTAKVGQQVITLAKEGYKTVVTSVYVTEGENGKVYNYPVDATLYKGAVAPTYKDNQYDVEAMLYDAATGAKITATPVVTVTGIDASKITKTEGKFTITDVEPGTYVADITATGYTATHATILVSATAKVEGKETETNIVVTYAAVNMQKVENATAKYYLQGNIKSAKTGASIIDATVSIALTSGATTTALVPTYTNGFYSVEIPADKVVPTTIVQVTVTKDEYYTATTSSLVIPVANNQTSVINLDVQLTPKSALINGSGSLDVAAGSTVTPDVAASSTPSDIQSILSGLGIDVSTAKVTTVATKSSKTMELVSSIANSTGEMEEQIDEVVIPVGTIYFTNATTAQNITITRDSRVEKASVGVRAFTGQPNGTVFGAPIEITFASPTSTTTTPDYSFATLYYDKATNTWKAEANNFADYNAAAKGFTGKIKHFSEFMFGFESEMKLAGTATLPAVTYPKAAYTGEAPQAITVNGKYQGGLKYEGNTPESAVKAAFPSMKEETVKYIASLFLNMIKSTYANMTPGLDYTPTDFSTPLTIDSYQQVSGFDLTRKEESHAFTIKVIDANHTVKAVTVKVSKIVSTELKANVTPNHGHGHGHGDDLNAGGGIVTLD